MGENPTRNGKSVLDRRSSLKFISGKGYHCSGPQATENLKQLKAEDSVRKFLASSVRYDRWLPVSLRTLEKAQHKLQHPALAVAISGAEWNLCDLLIWESYPASFARAEAWKHIEIGLGWVSHLRRKGEGRP